MAAASAAAANAKRKGRHNSRRVRAAARICASVAPEGDAAGALRYSAMTLRALHDQGTIALRSSRNA